MDLKNKVHTVLSGMFAIDNVVFSKNLENVQTVELDLSVRLFEVENW